MSRHSSISSSSSRRFAISAAMALVIIAVLEIFLFSRARIILDRTSLSRYYKSEVMKYGPDWDVVIFGSSRSIVIDAKKLQDAAGGRLNVYNFSVAEMGMNSTPYFTLKYYLKHHKRPKIIFITMINENLGVRNKDDIGTYPTTLDGVPSDALVVDRDIKGLCNFINPAVFLGNMSVRASIEILYTCTIRLLPSARYKEYIERAFPMEMFYDAHILKISIFRKQALFRKTAFNNDRILEQVAQSHGQMIYNEDIVVSKEELLKALPARGKSLEGIDNQNIWLEKFIKLADENNIKTVFFFMPLESSRYERMRELGWFDYADKQFRIYEKKYKNFSYYRDNNLSYDRRYFGDWSHLNKEGALKFNAEFVDDFNKIAELTAIKE